MSYEDIEEARIKRAAKDATKGKGKCGWKRKGIVLEADEPEPDESNELDPRLSNHTPYGHTQTIWSGNMVYTIYGHMVSYGHTAIQK